MGQNQIIKPKINQTAINFRLDDACNASPFFWLRYLAFMEYNEWCPNRCDSYSKLNGTTLESQ